MNCFEQEIFTILTRIFLKAYSNKAFSHNMLKLRKTKKITIKEIYLFWWFVRHTL